MKRLLLILSLWLPCAVFAQTTINLSVTYSTGAAAAAAAAGTNVTARVAGVVTAINAAYSASTINITLVPTTIAAGNTAPSDSAPISEQFSWVKNSPVAWQDRTTADASISIYISDVQGQTGATISATQPAEAANAAAVVPYSVIDTALEAAVSRIIGSTNGYANRVRSYPTDPVLLGQNYCWHTRESGPSNTSASVPYLPFWAVYWPLGSPLQGTESASASTSCEAFRQYFIANGGSRSTYASYQIQGSTYCYIYDSGGHQSAYAQEVYNSNPGSSTISCSENAINSYSKNGLMTSSPYLSLGNSGTDSVTPMNARASHVRDWKTLNATFLSRAKQRSWGGVMSWLNSW